MLAQAGIFDNRILGEAFRTMNKIDMAEEAAIPCTDGDGGKDVATPSYVTGPLTKDSSYAVTMEDFCKTEGTIIEYVCTDETYAPEWDGVAAAWEYDCPCQEGLCTNVVKTPDMLIMANNGEISGLFGTSETVAIKTPTKEGKESSPVSTDSFIDVNEQDTADSGTSFELYDCEDSDGGSNYYKKGTVTKSYRDGSVESLDDSCYTDGVRLAEFYCNDDGEMDYDIVECDFSCDSGACLLFKLSFTK
jgi:hypothetical protein